MECTGVGQVIADSMAELGASGIVCLTGVGHGGASPRWPRRMSPLGGAEEQRGGRQRERQQTALVQGRGSPRSRGSDLAGAPDHRRETPENFEQALERQPGDIKVVIQFSEV